MSIRALKMIRFIPLMKGKVSQSDNNSFQLKVTRKDLSTMLEELKQEEVRLDRLLVLKSAQSVQGGDDKMEVEIEVEGSKPEQKATSTTVAYDNGDFTMGTGHIFTQD